MNADVRTSAPASSWLDALEAAALFAVDPAGLGGIAVRAPCGPVREQWLAHLRALLPAGTPLRRMPGHIDDERLLGGLALAATLQAGRPVAQRGLLAESDGGVLLLAMAERLTPSRAAHLCAALDTGEAVTARDGIMLHSRCRVGVVAFDEGIGDDEHLSDALADRLAFHLDLTDVSLRDAFEPEASSDGFEGALAGARIRLRSVEAGDDIVQALCAAALALGIASVRAPLLSLRAACASAALDGRDAVSQDDAARAARLVLAPRATRLPTSEAPQDGADAAPAEEPPEPDPDPSASQPGSGPEHEPQSEQAETPPLADLVLEAAQSALPAGLLARLALGKTGLARSPVGGRAGVLKQARKRGRPIGALRGDPRCGARLDVIATLRAAAPWQKLRQRAGAASGAGRRIEVRADDFHVKRFQQRSETTTIFAIDASGSSALSRLAEAKGAVELLLADCYVRRDRVAVLAFRGRGAELLLPPTRSLVRAKRSLAGLPGGGGTPLAAGLDAALALADAVRRRGETPLLVVLTDGRGNIARDGSAGRARADADALLAARALRATGLASLLVDTSPQPQPAARRLADEMGATYLPLPYAPSGGAAMLARAARAAADRPGRAGG